ncbi:MAG: phage gp6-like head-tail connector protein [Snodgrassella sp.]|nr:phage gp6-like head-tail connector protein [Snodgrassella sp.]MCO6548379.1 phage gp6-like head-tail connector protein [Gilliamella sp.]MCO6554071.1 phage gp6-like head-tail connector protein [Gilliamella sp.]
MIVDLIDVKRFLQIEDDITEHDPVISALIESVHKRIERECNCIFLPKDTELPCDGKRYFIAEADVLLAIKILVCNLFEGRGGGSIPAHVEVMLHPFKEHAIG